MTLYNCLYLNVKDVHSKNTCNCARFFPPLSQVKSFKLEGGGAKFGGGSGPKKRSIRDVFGEGEEEEEGETQQQPIQKRKRVR